METWKCTCFLQSPSWEINIVPACRSQKSRARSMPSVWHWLEHAAPPRAECGLRKWRQSTCTLNSPSFQECFPRREEKRPRNVAHADNTGSDRLFPQTWISLLHHNWSCNQGSVSRLSRQSKLRYPISLRSDR